MMFRQFSVPGMIVGYLPTHTGATWISGNTTPKGKRAKGSSAFEFKIVWEVISSALNLLELKPQIRGAKKHQWDEGP